MRMSDWSTDVCSSDHKGLPSPPAKRSCATAANRIPFSERRRILSLSLCDDYASPSLIVIALPSELVGQFEPIIARLTRVADIRRKGWQADHRRRQIFIVEYIAHEERRADIRPADIAQVETGIPQIVARESPRLHLIEIGRASGRERVCQYV